MKKIEKNSLQSKVSFVDFQENIWPYYDAIDSSFRGILKDYFLSNKPFRITWTSALMIPKSILEEFRGFNENVEVVEDIELWIKIALLYPVAITNKVTALYNFNSPNSLTKRKICMLYNTFLAIFFNSFERLRCYFVTFS